MIRKIRKLAESKVVKNGFWLLVLQGFNTIIPMLTIPYITRLLSKGSYGEFSLALNWIGYFQVVVEYGFGLTGARKVAVSKDRAEINHIHSKRDLIF